MKIDEAYNQKNTSKISIVGGGVAGGIGKSSLAKSFFNIFEDIQAKQRIFNREINKSSDCSALRAKQELQQQFHPLFFYFSGHGSMDDSLPQIPYLYIGSFSYIKNPIISTLTPTDISDFERAYHATFPDGDTFETLPATNSHSPFDQSAIIYVSVNIGRILFLQLINYHKALTYSITLLKKRNREAAKLQYIADQAHNRVSRSPTPQKKEPPVGGVKVGGEQHNFSRYVATILYLKQKRREVSPTSSTGKYANYGREGPGLFHLKGHAKWPETSFRLKMKTQVRSLMSREKIKTQTKSLLSKNKTIHKLSTIQANLILRW